ARVVTGLWPSCAIAGSPAVTLMINGANFLPSSTVTFGITGLTVASQSPTSIVVNVPASLLTAAGNASVTVTNPAPGGGSSSSTFVIQAGSGCMTFPAGLIPFNSVSYISQP